MRASLFLSALLFAVCGQFPRSAGPPATTQGTGAEEQVYTRDEFRALVVGRTPAEVLVAVGPPESASEDGATSYWCFPVRIKEPVTGKIDSGAQVGIEGGRARRVGY